MERNFKNEDFEQFLKLSADGLRMRPSEKVWKRISGNLNRRRRRFGYFLGISLLATSAIGYYLLEPSNANSSNRHLADYRNSLQTQNSEPEKSLTGKTPVQASLDGSPVNQPKNIQLGQQRSTGTNGFILTKQDLIATQNNTVSSNDVAANEFTPTIVDSNPESQGANSAARNNEQKQDIVYPMTIESVTNSYAPKFRKGKVGLQMFFTPTVSYRRLRENTTYSGSFVGVHDLNSAVNHKPDLGFQVGILAKYPVSKKIKLTGGVQFNVNRYDIKTFSSSYEVATIRFNNRQTVNAVTGYNNFNGYKADRLENLYLSISAPLGVEVKLAGNDKTSFGVATSIQPTYVIGDRAYLISSDYKNYMEVPWLVRDWNVSTGFETFVAASTGQVKWQVGPQVRYQLLSSYEKKYPVKEHLFDFGLRVGISLNNR